MKVSLILCHPKQGSFNHALANSLFSGLVTAGHQVRFHDLHAEAFDPVLTEAELVRDAKLPVVLENHVAELCEAEGLVLVHPNYWGRPPALLCGWVDRVLRPGRAYIFEPDGNGGAIPKGLLKLRFASVVVTANTPREKEVELYGDPIDLHWRKVVFGLFGVPQVEVLPVSPVIVSSPEQRATWLAEVSSRVCALAELASRKIA